MAKRGNTAEEPVELAALVALQRELAALDPMTVGELAQKYQEVLGRPTRSRNKDYLRRHIAWNIQAQREGRSAPRALDHLRALACQAPRRWRESAPAFELPKKTRDPRLPRPGTVVTRLRDGVEHEVVVLDEDFAYKGKRYRSLSSIAKIITGKDWNGYRFFFGNAASGKDAP